MISDTKENSAAPLEAKSSEESAPDLQNSIQGSVVLVVEDEKSILMSICKILEKFGHDVHGASSATEALGILGTVRPEVILSDISMPNIDGIMFCERIRANRNLLDVPVIFLTQFSDQNTLRKAYQAGGDDYVVKPVRPYELSSRIHHHISEYRARMAAKGEISRLSDQRQAMANFVSGASHDLRNPLVSIRGIAHYLKTERFGSLNTTQADLVESVHLAAESMLDLVEELLEVSRLSDQGFKLELEDQNVDTLIDMAVMLHKVRASDKQINIAKRATNAEISARIDRKLLTRLIDNLVSNAIKFSEKNTEIGIYCELEEDLFRLVVEDQGPGIPEAEKDKLFKQYSKTSNEPTGNESSHGLGLFTCFKIARLHCGNIFQENRPTGGSRFILEIPQ